MRSTVSVKSVIMNYAEPNLRVHLIKHQEEALQEEMVIQINNSSKLGVAS